ncbi:hypothetical protein [Guptibacillus algicola]|nr:hypothetical protein [Alkalihalobacillus algicola]
MRSAFLPLLLLLVVPVIIVSKKINEHDKILEHRQRDRTGIR